MPSQYLCEAQGDLHARVGALGNGSVQALSYHMKQASNKKYASDIYIRVRPFLPMIASFALLEAEPEDFLTTTFSFFFSPGAADFLALMSEGEIVGAGSGAGVFLDWWGVG